MLEAHPQPPMILSVEAPSLAFQDEKKERD
jgi:hypothetical protein